MSLATLLEPRSVAIIGASEKEGSIGKIVTANMLEANFKGNIFPVNPRYEKILGLVCYQSILDIPFSVDLVVIVTGAKLVPQLLRDIALKKVPTVIVMSAGFKETGDEGKELENTILQVAKESEIRILGPNCLGCLNPRIGLNASFAAGGGVHGRVAFLSQSGALCTAFLDWSLEKHLGFSTFISLGSMSDIDWSDLLEYLENDSHTDAIFIYMETIGDAKKFRHIASRVAKKKPIFVIKVGKTEAAAQAAASHTGSLTGNDDLFTFAMDQIGIKRLDTIEEFFHIALCIGKQPFPKGNHLTIITNGGGPGVLAVDAALKNGALLSPLSTDSYHQLNNILPPYWSHGNPIDVLGDADKSRYAEAIKACLKDPQTDGMLVILTPQDMTDSYGTAQVLVEYQKKSEKTLLASWMGSQYVIEGRRFLDSQSIPCYDYPDAAAKTFGMIATHLEYMRRLPEFHLPNFSKTNPSKNISIEESSKILSETASKEIIYAAGIPTVRNFIATTAQEAIYHAEQIGYPVVVKLHSLSITHKMDVGGVKLNLMDALSVKVAFEEIQASLKRLNVPFEGVSVQKMILNKGVEVILGSIEDPQWGPVILFGAGGEFVEVYKDRVLALPPFSPQYAQELIQKTKIYSILKGVRNKPSVDIEGVCEILVKFSEFILCHPMIKECDINPLLVLQEECIALDARIILK